MGFYGFPTGNYGLFMGFLRVCQNQVFLNLWDFDGKNMGFYGLLWDVHGFFMVFFALPTFFSKKHQEV